MNNRWSAQLKQFQSYQKVTKPNFKFSLRELFMATTFLAVYIGLTVHFIRLEKPPKTEHISPRDAPAFFKIPDTASDVSYSNHYPAIKACEFTASEETYVAWLNRFRADQKVPPVRLKRS